MKPRTMREWLELPFPTEATFHLYKGAPYLVVADWDYAEYWGVDPPRESHPFAPYWWGTKIPEEEFRALVRKLREIWDERSVVHCNWSLVNKKEKL